VDDDVHEQVIYGETPSLTAWPVTTAGEASDTTTTSPTDKPVQVVTLVITKTVTKRAEGTSLPAV
jgi:hypothetical protein